MRNDGVIGQIGRTDAVPITVPMGGLVEEVLAMAADDAPNAPVDRGQPTGSIGLVAESAERSRRAATRI